MPRRNCGPAAKFSRDECTPERIEIYEALWLIVFPNAGCFLCRVAAGTAGRTTACSTASAISPSGSGADSGSTRRFGGADRTLPGSAGKSDPGGVYISVRARPSPAMAATKSWSHGRCSDPSGATAKLGSEHTGPGGFSRPCQTVEPGHHVDDKSWKCVFESARRRDGRRAANAVQGAAKRETVLDQPANMHHHERLRATRHRDRAR
jgi:hypothetical protein